MKLLALDTSGKTVSVAFVSDDVTVGEIFWGCDKGWDINMVTA